VISPRFKGALAHVAKGKYGRTFSDLPALEIDEGLLPALGRVGSGMDVSPDREGDSLSDNPRIPAGFTFLGQFIAHDITRDPSLLHHARNGQLRNFRAPRLDLEAVYGGGPLSNPYFFDKNDPDCFLIGKNELGVAEDVPRNPHGLALIADSRNDVHTVISQLHLAFLRFHNAIIGKLPSSNVTCRSPRNPCINSRIVVDFVSITDSMIGFPATSSTATEIVAVWTSMLMYLRLFIDGAPFWVK
jgi:hypothetical protein